MQPLSFYENIVPLVAPIDGGAGSPATPYLDLKGANTATILIYFGVVTSVTATDTLTVTVEASSASTSNASETAIAFNYRLSDTVAGGNTWGAYSAATSAGLSMGASTVFDGFALEISLDPAAVQAAHAGARWVRAVLTPSAAFSVLLYTVIGFIQPTDRATTMQTQTVT